MGTITQHRLETSSRVAAAWCILHGRHLSRDEKKDVACSRPLCVLVPFGWSLVGTPLHDTAIKSSDQEECEPALPPPGQHNQLGESTRRCGLDATLLSPVGMVSFRTSRWIKGVEALAQNFFG